MSKMVRMKSLSPLNEFILYYFNNNFKFFILVLSNFQ